MDVPEAVRLLNMTLGLWREALADPTFKVEDHVSVLKADIEWMSQAMSVITDWSP